MYVRGDEGKKVCIMIVCIVFTIPNENKPYFGGKTEDRDTG